MRTGKGRTLRVVVRAVRPSDAEAWLRLRCDLWPEGSEAEHREDIARFFAGESTEPLAVLLAEDAAGRLIGFAELSIRSHAESCLSRGVAYLEGWYVAPEARGKGVGRALVAAAEEWGRQQGCREFASDTQVDNAARAAAHRALGFTEVAVVRCFRKNL